MTDNEKNRCKELLQNKDLFISLCMKENPALGARLDSLYEPYLRQKQYWPCLHLPCQVLHMWKTTRCNLLLILNLFFRKFFS